MLAKRLIKLQKYFNVLKGDQAKKYGSWLLLVLSVFVAFLAGNFIGNKFKDIQNTLPVKSEEADSTSPQIAYSGPLSPAPGLETSMEEKSAYGKILHGMAIKASSMKIGSDCLLEPTVASVRESSTFYFENTDSRAHKIRIESLDILLAPGEKKNITVKFGHGLGYYGIQCDNKIAVAFFEIGPAASNP